MTFFEIWPPNPDTKHQPDKKKGKGYPRAGTKKVDRRATASGLMPLAATRPLTKFHSYFDSYFDGALLGLFCR